MKSLRGLEIIWVLIFQELSKLAPPIRQDRDDEKGFEGFSREKCNFNGKLYIVLMD